MKRIGLYIAKRTAGSLIVILLITVVLFLIFFMLPTNAAQLSCGKPCTPAQLARVSAFMGTDKPWYEQMWNYLSGMVAGRTFGTGAGAVVCSAPCLGYCALDADWSRVGCACRDEA